MPDFVSPIMETLFKQQEAIRDQKKFQETQRASKVQEALDARKQDDLEKYHDNEVKIHQAETDANKAHLDALHKQTVFENISKLVAAGGTPPPGFQVDAKGNPSGNPKLNPDQVSSDGYSFAKSLFATPDQIAQSAGNKEAATQTALYKAQLPARLAEQQQRAADQKTLNDQQNAAKLQTDAQHAQEVVANAEANRKSNELIHQGQQDTQKFLGQLAASVRLQTAAKGSTDSEPIIKSYINDAYITGAQPNIPVKYVGAVKKSLPEGWTPISKDDKSVIESIPTIDNIINKVDKLADLGSGFGGTLSAVTGFGDAGVARKEVQGLLGNLVTVFDKQKGKFSQQEIERVNSLIYDPKASTAKNKEKAVQLKGLLEDKVAPILAKYPPDQREMILHGHAIDANRFSNIKDSVSTPAAPAAALPSIKDPKLINYAKEHFNGDTDAALKAIAAQRAAGK